MPSLPQLLAQQPPTTSGVHEAMALHAEDVFENLRGILPLFLGKRRLGPYFTLALPNRVTSDSETLLQSIGDLIAVYDLRLVSLLTAIRVNHPDRSPSLCALLLTADNAKALFQLPWELAFDGQGDIAQATRSVLDSEIIPRDVWAQLFQQKPEPAEKAVAYERLVERFGGSDEIPKP